jgi:hypothetical protein
MQAIGSSKKRVMFEEFRGLLGLDMRFWGELENKWVAGQPEWNQRFLVAAFWDVLASRGL